MKNAYEFDRAGFVERLNEAIEALASVRAFAGDAGIPQSTLARYTAGQGGEKFEVVAAAALHGGVSLDWLAFGGEKQSASIPATPYEDFTDLHAAIWSNLQPLIDQGHIQISPNVSPIKLTASIARSLEILKNSDIKTGDGKRGLIVGNHEEDTASYALVSIMDAQGITDQQLADKMQVEVTLIETLKTDELEWDTELAMKVAEALEVSPLKFLTPGQEDPLGDEFFRQWSKLSDEDRSKVSAVLQSLVQSSEDDQH